MKKVLLGIIACIMMLISCKKNDDNNNNNGNGNGGSGGDPYVEDNSPLNHEFKVGKYRFDIKGLISTQPGVPGATRIPLRGEEGDSTASVTIYFNINNRGSNVIKPGDHYIQGWESPVYPALNHIIIEGKGWGKNIRTIETPNNGGKAVTVSYDANGKLRITIPKITIGIYQPGSPQTIIDSTTFDADIKQ